MFQFSHNLWRGQKKHTDTPPCFVSLYRYSEENRPCGVLHSCCLSSLDTSHHGANDEKKEKVRVIFIFLWRTWLTCVHIAICLSLSCWCFYMLALETHPCGNTSFKAIRFNLNARFMSTMWWVGGFFFFRLQKQRAHSTPEKEKGLQQDVSEQFESLNMLKDQDSACQNKVMPMPSTSSNSSNLSEVLDNYWEEYDRKSYSR